MVPSRFSMKKAPAIRLVTYSGERLFFIFPVYERNEYPLRLERCHRCCSPVRSVEFRSRPDRLCARTPG
jgi:hypothetical protein